MATKKETAAVIKKEEKPKGKEKKDSTAKPKKDSVVLAAESNFVLLRCKREEYIAAWGHMYKNNKKEINSNPLYDEINPALNKKPLGTEINNFCTVIFDKTKPCEEFKLGTPVGIFSFVVTPGKVIGKQFLVLPQYLGMGLGKAILIENEKTLIENSFDKYYIGCSKCSAGIYKGWGIEPFFSDEAHDMYKFDVELTRENFDAEYKHSILDKGIEVTK